MAKFIPHNEYLAMAGTDLGHSKWLKITQERINLFADATDDHQFIHVDEERAAKTPMGCTIAHGFLTLSLLSSMAGELTAALPEGYKMTFNYGLNSLRFLAPVKVNREIRAKGVVKEVVEKKPGQFKVTTDITVEIKGEDKPALIAESVAMHVCG